MTISDAALVLSVVFSATSLYGFLYLRDSYYRSIKRDREDIKLLLDNSDLRDKRFDRLDEFRKSHDDAIKKLFKAVTDMIRADTRRMTSIEHLKSRMAIVEKKIPLEYYKEADNG